MKTKVKHFFILIGVVFAGTLLTAAFWFVVSELFGYSIKEILERLVVNGYPLWGNIRSVIIVGLCVLTCFWLFVCTMLCFSVQKRTRQKTITLSSRMVKSYFSQELNADEIFPREYLELSAEAAEVKAVMLRHEQALKEESARKNDLVTYLAHDLKTPLTSVIGYLSLMEEAPEMPQEQRSKYIGITLKKAIRLEQLIDEFFEITRYNLQHITLQKETFSLPFLLTQLADEFYPILSAHGNIIKISAPENLTIYGDPDKLARVFSNILKNAVSYSYPNTPILLSVFSKPNQVQIVCTNTGATIPPHRLEQIFEKFFRLDNARNTNSGGAGLGLAIAKEIVSLHGGSITAKSENEHTAFIVTLPA